MSLLELLILMSVGAAAGALALAAGWLLSCRARQTRDVCLVERDAEACLRQHERRPQRATRIESTPDTGPIILFRN